MSKRRRQARALYQAPPERFADVAEAWLERFVIGAAGRLRPRPKMVRVAEDCLRYVAPPNEIAIERIRRPLVEDLLADAAPVRGRSPAGRNRARIGRFRRA